MNLADKTRAITVGMVACIALVGSPAAAAGDEGTTGRVLSVRGEAWIIPPGATDDDEEQLQRGRRFAAGATLRTGENGGLRLLMQDKSLLSLGPKARLTIKEYDVRKNERRVTLRVAVGRLWGRISKLFGSERNYTIEGQNAVAGIRGTDVVVDVAENGTTTITCLTGVVEFIGVDNDVTLNPGQSGALDDRGKVVVLTLTPQQIEELVATARAREKLDERREDDGDRGPNQGPDPNDTGGPSPNDDGTANQNVPLDLEPGVTTEVRGRIEVRER